MNPTAEHSILRWFNSDHLPPELQNVVRPFETLARGLDAGLPNGPEKSAGLRKLLEAKDCMVRAALSA